MKKRSGLSAIERVAERNGVSVKQVRNDIQAVIDAGLASPDPAVRARWRQMSARGETPTPEDVIEYMAEKTHKRITVEKRTGLKILN